MNLVLYGLETMQLPKSDQDRAPTHIDREWTNRKAIDELHLRAQYKHGKLSARFLLKVRL